jgi:hypothetical protein
MSNFLADLDWCIEHRRPHALSLPWVNRDSGESIAAAESGLIGRGWALNDALMRWERGGWYVWFYSPAGSAPVAKFDRISPWGDEIDGWGPAHIGFVDVSLACPDCGDYSEDGLCRECRAAESVRKQLTLF